MSSTKGRSSRTVVSLEAGCLSKPLKRLLYKWMSTSCVYEGQRLLTRSGGVFRVCRRSTAGKSVFADDRVRSRGRVIQGQSEEDCASVPSYLRCCSPFD